MPRLSPRPPPSPLRGWCRMVSLIPPVLLASPLREFALHLSCDAANGESSALTHIFSACHHHQKYATPPTPPPPLFFLDKILHLQIFHPQLPRIHRKHDHQDVRTAIICQVFPMLTCDRFFDVTWEGPVLDASGKPTSKVQGELQLPHYDLAQTLFIIKPISIVLT